MAWPGKAVSRIVGAESACVPIGKWYTLRKTAPTTVIPGQSQIQYAASGNTIDKALYWFGVVDIPENYALVAEFTLGECVKTSYVCGVACTGLVSSTAGITYNNCTLAGTSTSSNCVQLNYTDSAYSKTGATLMVRLTSGTIYGLAIALDPSLSWPSATQYCDSAELVRAFMVRTA